MNKAEFNSAFQLAKNGGGSFDNIDLFDGFGLKGFRPVCCTLAAMAGLIKWQALQFDGHWDSSAVDEIWEARRKFIIADSLE